MIAMNQIVQAIENAHLATDRVRSHTAPNVNARIDRLTASNVQSCIREGSEAIVRRLTELDAEWDVDRVLMVNFALAGGMTFMTGLHRYTTAPLLGPRPRGFLYFFGAQLGFLLLHGLAGWCPPVVVFRRLGVRTQREIEVERALLEAALAAKAA
jgi:hypothetical protein